MLDAGYHDHLVSYRDHAVYWQNMKREYPDHPVAAHPDRWRHCFGATLYGNFG